MADGDIKIEVSEDPIENEFEIKIKTEPFHLEIENELLETNIKTEWSHLDIENESKPQNNVTQQSKEKIYKCKTCSKILAKTSLYRHQKRCNIERSKKIKLPHSCDICEMRFETKSQMYSHRHIEHNVLNIRKSFPCDICSKVFPWRGRLLKHKERWHMEHSKKIKLPHPCDICEMSFATKYEMYSHRDVEHKNAPVNESSSHSESNVFNLNLFRNQEKPGTESSHLDIKNELLEINIKTELSHDQSYSNSESTIFDLDLFRNKGKVLKLFDNCRHFVNDGNIFYECQSCLQIFGKGLEFIEDQISHSSESSIKIDWEDPDLIRALEILDDSKIIKEDQTVTHKCQTCQTEVSTEVDFIEHQKTHLDDSKSVNNDNDKVLLSSEGVPINNCEKKETQSFPCDICSKVFTGKRYMYIHRERFHNIAPPLKRVDIWKKYEIEKDGKKYWKCDFCEKIIATKFRFIDHRELHTKSADELKRFICEICAKIFRLKCNLKKHMRTHDNIRNHTCDVCGSAFKNAEDFKDHMNIHTDNRPYKCDICSKSYRQRTTLWSHKQQVHSNERKYSCNLCDYKTHLSHNLKLHMLKHTGEKPYVCSVCGEAYRARDTLRIHMYTHKKEKHPCEICGEIFSQPRYLQRHMRKKHRGLEKKN